MPPLCSHLLLQLLGQLLHPLELRPTSFQF